MRYPAGHKEQTRARILEAAGRVFRRNGYHASGVDSVMEEAGLTAGGFYAHFDSKDALFAEALAQATSAVGERDEAKVGEPMGGAWVEAFLSRYLCKRHVGAIEQGCPLVALVSEVSRSDESVKKSFETILRQLVAELAAHVDSGCRDRAEVQALAVIAICVGGLGLARCVQDEMMAATILDACRSAANQVLDSKANASRTDPP